MDDQVKVNSLILASAAMWATVAHAQSSVTLYGLLDAGVTYTNNQHVSGTTGHSNVQATSGNLNSDRWGLRGSEDLGSGMHAIFTLENGFSITNGKLGQGGRMFGRQAWVGLATDQYGSVTLGRQYDSVVDYLGPMSLTGTQYGGTQFAHPFDNDNLDNSFRVDNAIKYASANYSGLKFGGVYGFSNQAGAFANNRLYSLGASYNTGPLNVAAAYMEINQPGVNSGGALDGTSTSADAPFTAQRQRVWGAGANYSFGAATVGLVWTQTKLDSATTISTGSPSSPTKFGNASGLSFNNYELNARYDLTPAWRISGAYTFTDGRLSNATTNAKPKWNQISLLSDYALSKRTDLYLEGVYQHVNGASGTVLNGALINGIGAQSATNTQVAVTAGIRTRF
ncbi:porin [Paraburkholderia madseniana]|jgi:GBP family porin|uniref:Porin n=1 Tax=Paraburkholderia madseniana TaxID=2599607 RepID=A0A6N6WD05_9BURK|nr:porin [Paraburkholderia madseniana]NPT68117.1 porin [Paraburkholderia madseniana]